MTLELGTTDINQLYLGTTEIKKAYLGSTLIHDTTAVGGITDPTDIADCKFWYDSTDVNSGAEPTDDDNISGWQDLSGSGWDLAQGTATNQPKYKTNIQNGKPGILFADGDFMEYLGSNTAQPWTVIAVAKTTISNIGQYLFSSATNASYRNAFLVLGSGNFSLFAGSSLPSLHTSDTNPHIFQCYFSGSSSYLRMDGTDSSTSAIGTNNFEPVTVGGPHNSPTNEEWNGYIFEMFAYNKTLTAQNITDIDNYLSTKWNITV